MTRILFVCHGNICRSPMAEFIMKEKVRKLSLAEDFYIESAATSTEEIGNDIHYGAKTKLRRENIPFSRRGARQMSRGDYARFDYIIGMDSYNIRNILRIIGSDPEKKVYKLLDFTSRGGDIADPWYTGDFEPTYCDINEGCDGVIERVRGR